LGSTSAKAVRGTLMKLTPDVGRVANVAAVSKFYCAENKAPMFFSLSLSDAVYSASSPPLSNSVFTGFPGFTFSAGPLHIYDNLLLLLYLIII